MKVILNDESLIDLLKQSRQNDMRAHYTTKGVHKDDLQFQIGEHPMKKFGSQGQQKSFVIALKLAQFDYLKELKNRKPILLLDDIFDKLDDNRVGALMKLVSEDHFGQIFLTDANLHRVPDLFKDENVPLKKFKVEIGCCGRNESMRFKPRKHNQESLGEVIDRMLDVYRLRSGLTELSINSEWSTIAGPAIASRTDEVILRGSKLIIRLNSPALRQELNYQREQIMENVNQFIGKDTVKEILLQ